MRCCAAVAPPPHAPPPHRRHATVAQWNNRIGEVVGFDRSALRYEVLMSEKQTLRIKLENVLL